MLAKRIIPCLDVTGGRVVKGVNFVELRDAGDPVEIAARYNEQGADELTFLDITATSDGRDLILHIIEAVASQVFIPLTVGGGVRTVDDVRRLLNAGADKTSFNSAAEGEGEKFFGEGGGEEFGAEEESAFEAGDAIKLTAVGETAAGVDGVVVFLGAPTADGVEIFEGETDGVHHVVTTGAGGVFAVFGEALADG